MQHHALILIAPEHDRGIASAVKNALDWATSLHALTARELLLEGKHTALITFSPNHSVGVQVLNQTAAVCHALGSVALPCAMGILASNAMLQEAGGLSDKVLVKCLDALVQALVQTCDE